MLKTYLTIARAESLFIKYCKTIIKLARINPLYFKNQRRATFSRAIYFPCRIDQKSILIIAIRIQSYKTQITSKTSSSLGSTTLQIKLECTLILGRSQIHFSKASAVTWLNNNSFKITEISILNHKAKMDVASQK